MTSERVYLLKLKPFGWDWERWADGDVQSGRHVFRLFGITVLGTPSIYLGTWWEDSNQEGEPK